LIDQAKDRVRKLREASHLDKNIVNGKSDAEADVAIRPGRRGVHLTGNSISYAELGRWIEQIRPFALLLSHVHVEAGERPRNE
jgi:hypothetical protein